MPLGTSTSSWRVYQFHQGRKTVWLYIPYQVLPLMSISVPVDEYNMMSRNVFWAAGICSIAIMCGFLSGCASRPDVWNLLASGDGEMARPFFMGEVDVNDRDRLGRSPLHLAAENRDTRLAEFFISLGAEVDAVDGARRTALAISAEKLDAPTAKILAAAGADIHHPMPDGSSPAHIAVQPGNEAFLAALLTTESLHAADSSGRTILHVAAAAGNAAAVESILGAGGILSTEDMAGITALDIALERRDSRNHAETAERLIQAGAVSDDPLYSYLAPAARTSNYNIRGAEGMAPIHFIARMGYTGYLTFLLERNADVNIQNASGATPLHEAARSGNVGVMEALLDRGASINTQDASGNSVLHIAIPPESHLAALYLFLSRGADVNLPDEHGISPLHIAIMLNRGEDIIRALLEAGADISSRNGEGKTPLYMAMEYGRGNLIPLLLSFGADIFAADNNGVTPFEMALKTNSPQIYFLISGETVLRRDGAGNTMLHLTVASGGDTRILDNILNYPVSVNARNNAGDTALTVAVRLNKSEAGELLLKRGADIFAANTAGESPLSLTFPGPGADPAELRRWMLSAENLAVRDRVGNTALHYAAQWRLDYWIPLLVELGAKTEAANTAGETPLFTAVRHDSASGIRVLASSGALLSARDNLGNTALHASVRWQAINGAGALIDLGMDINSHALNGKTALHDSIRLGMPEFQMLLLRRGADIEVRDADGNTPFMEAIFAGNPETMELLAGVDADPNTRNFHGNTPLHIAVAMERTDLTNLLLGLGVSIHDRNSRGRTPLQEALVASPGLVTTLLTRDRLHLADNNGSSPLHIAVQERAPASMIATIMGLGVRLSSVDAEGRTPIRLAVDLGQWESARLLADSGSDVFITARDGVSAAEMSLRKGEEAVSALFSGRSLNATDASGNTILHYAARRGDTTVISQLLALGAFKEVRNIAAESPAEIALRWNHHDAAALLN